MSPRALGSAMWNWASAGSVVADTGGWALLRRGMPATGPCSIQVEMHIGRAPSCKKFLEKTKRNEKKALGPSWFQNKKEVASSPPWLPGNGHSHLAAPPWFISS